MEIPLFLINLGHLEFLISWGVNVGCLWLVEFMMFKLLIKLGKVLLSVWADEIKFFNSSVSFNLRSVTIIFFNWIKSIEPFSYKSNFSFIFFTIFYGLKIFNTSFSFFGFSTLSLVDLLGLILFYLLLDAFIIK